MKTRLKLGRFFLTVLASLSLLPTAHAYYDPVAQRWLNRDPLGDMGSPVYTHDSTVYSFIREPVEMWQSANLFSFVLNRPTDFIDPWGLAGQLCTDKNCDKKKCPAKNLPEDGWEDKRNKGENPWEDIPEPRVL